MARTKGGTTLGWRTIRRDTKGCFYADQDRYTVVMRRGGGVHVCALRLDIPPPRRQEAILVDRSIIHSSFQHVLIFHC